MIADRNQLPLLSRLLSEMQMVCFLDGFPAFSAHGRRYGRRACHSRMEWVHVFPLALPVMHLC